MLMRWIAAAFVMVAFWAPVQGEEPINSDDAVRLRPTHTWVPQPRFSSDVQHLAWLPDSRHLLVTSDHSVLVCRTDGRLVEQPFPANGYNSFGIAHSLAVSPDGRRFATGHSSGNVLIWDSGEVALLATLPLMERRGTRALTFSADGRWLACCAGDGTLQIWNVSTLQKLATVSGERGRIKSFAFCDDGTLIAVSYESKPGIEVWNWEAGEVVASLSGYFDPFHTTLRFRQGDRTLIVASEDKLRFWDVTTDNEPRTVRVRTSQKEPSEAGYIPLEPFSGPCHTNTVALSVDESVAAIDDEHGTIHIWDMATQSIRCSCVGPRLENTLGGGVRSFALSPDGQWLAATVHGHVEMWRLPDAEADP
jgi:WD40 repeat protein